MEEMKNERDKLIELFDKDTDLKEKVIISGVKYVYFLLINHIGRFASSE